MIEANNRIIPPSAKLLGYAGVLPFAALALTHLVGGAEASQHALRGFVAYGAVILSFLGGIRWGVASRFNRSQAAALAFSVLPSLWAFACLLWPAQETAIWGLLMGFTFLGMVDWLIPAPGSAAWLTRLRARLSMAAVACHVLLITSLTAT